MTRPPLDTVMPFAITIAEEIQNLRVSTARRGSLPSVRALNTHDANLLFNRSPDQSLLYNPFNIDNTILETILQRSRKNQVASENNNKYAKERQRPLLTGQDLFNDSLNVHMSTSDMVDQVGWLQSLDDVSGVNSRTTRCNKTSIQSVSEELFEENLPQKDCSCISTYYCRDKNVLQLKLHSTNMASLVVDESKKIYAKFSLMADTIKKKKTTWFSFTQDILWDEDITFSNVTLKNLSSGIVSVKFISRSKFGFTNKCVAKTRIRLGQQDHDTPYEIRVIKCEYNVK